MTNIILLRAKEILDPFIQTTSWLRNDFCPPSPSFVKRKILRREGIDNGAWIETGTYLGGTTKALSEFSPQVISIEPSKWLHQHATRRLRERKNVRILNGTSEDLLESAIKSITSKNLNLWLDGHFSAGITYQGESDTPIMRELEIVSRHFQRFENVKIFIDDIRCFSEGTHRDQSYPNIEVLPAWCEKFSFDWQIEHDIFIAAKRPNESTSAMAASSTK